MALSFCSKRPYSSLHNLINPDIISLFPQTQAELGSSCFFDFDVYDEYISLSDSSYSVDSLFDTNNINDCKPQNAFPDDSLDEEISRHPKRQKTVSENHCRFTYSSATNTTNPEFSNGYVPIPSFSPEFSNFPSEAILSACWGNQEMIKSEAMKKDSSRSGCCRSATGTTAVSAQSIAARERRRKITEKTQELGKLIPGGNKMNTAEMLQAAYKYVKFLQAQVTVLQLLRSIQVISKRVIGTLLGLAQRVRGEDFKI
ncbi:hypothetical protein TIFTF001_033861 [Ficus carica]|uniref:BHLH domain-containing protein n=1 Tax=Ficus carica TaxID=3494 RepID=A0AA88DZD1_FICCA|nr:hypothetical protein TIFTF001_033861 [Ficus carica]